MRKSSTLLCAILVSLAIVSCQKEAENPSISSSDINGTWKLVSIQAQTMVTNQVTSGPDVDKTVTTSNYTSTNNTGTINFTSGSMSYSNLSYAINTVAKATLYHNGAFVDTISVPMQMTVPATSSTSTYTRVGADSIYFPAGFFQMGQTTQATQASGCKIRFEQDKMYLLQTGSQTTATTEQGSTILSIASLTATTTLQRQ